MTDNPNAESSESTGEQTPSEIGNQEKADQPSQDNVTEDEKMDQEKDAEEEKSEESQEDSEPFHKHPRFQQLIRKTQRQGKENAELQKSLHEAKELIKELAAQSRGEEYSPEPYSAPAVDPSETFLDEMAEIAERDDLSNAQIDEVRTIAEKFGISDGEKTVPQPPDIAYKLWKELNAEKGKTPSTRPSKKVSEDRVTKAVDQSPPHQSLDSIWSEMDKGHQAYLAANG